LTLIKVTSATQQSLGSKKICTSTAHQIIYNM